MSSIVKVLIPFLFIFGLIVFQVYRENQVKKFYRDAIDTMCIDYSDWMGNSRTFYLEGRYTMIFLLERQSNIDDKLKVGDRIKKEANTKEYHVYRKNDQGEYVFYRKGSY